MTIVEDEYVTGAGYVAVSDQVASMSMSVACADDQDAPCGKERGGDRQADLWRHHRAKGFVPPELPAEPSPSVADFFSDSHL